MMYKMFQRNFQSDTFYYIAMIRDTFDLMIIFHVFFLTNFSNTSAMCCNIFKPTFTDLLANVSFNLQRQIGNEK